MAEEKKKSKLYTRLRNKYRLVIMNDDTFEEKVSLRLTPLNVFVFAGTLALTLITLVIYLIAFTSLREYIPGYADINMQRHVRQLTLKADSLEKEVSYKDWYIQNIKNIVEGTVGDADTFKKQTTTLEGMASASKFDTISVLQKSKEDSLLRSQVESEDSYTLNVTENKGTSGSISNFFFFTPLNGTITNAFNPVSLHYGVDIVAAQNEAIKATLDGVVLFAGWTSETGYVIALQHSNNIVSLYKHNSALLKKAGNFVKAGEVIAIIGNTGELTSGPHLHFELWYNGSPVNPKEYMAF